MALRPRLADRCARHFFSCFISARCGNGPWLIRATPAFGPDGFVGRTGKGDHVERQRDFAHDALDLLGSASRGTKKPLAPASGKGFAALDHLIDQRIVIGLRLQEQVGSGVDEEVVADRTADRRDTAALQVERVQPFAADDLVLEIAADSAGLRQPRDVAPPSSGSAE